MTSQKLKIIRTDPPLFPPAWAGEWAYDQIGWRTALIHQGISPECCQVFRWIKPGTFMMGSPEDEPERYENEVLHQVTLTNGFWLAETACTQALWKDIMGENPSGFKGDDRPVETVSWEDVQNFLKKLNELLPDAQFRLPTEAEWEYACRAGTVTPFSFGDNITAYNTRTDQANFDGNYPYNNAEKGQYRGETVPVKSFFPNQWGLYQMHGNVYEWCEDWKGDYDLSNTVDPEGPGTGEGRVMRGGSWFYSAGRCRSAYRYWHHPAFRFGGIGFRLVQGHQ